MKILTVGHKYELANMEGESSQFLQFIEKQLTEKEWAEAPDEWVPDPAYLPDKILMRGFVTVKNGTTNEEVLAVLIDRMNYLQGKASCRENAIVITKLEECLMWLNKRTRDRVARNVEGTPAV
jgi:hypothetical protein